MVKNIIGSILFLASYVTIFWYVICLGKKWRGKSDHWNVFWGAFLCSFTVLFEPTSRITELGLFMFPRTILGVFLWFEKRGYYKPYDNLEVLFFAIAFSLIMYLYQNEERLIRPTYLSMFKRFLGRN